MSVTQFSGHLTDYLVEIGQLPPWAEKAVGEESAFFDQKIAQMDSRLSDLFKLIEELFIERMSDYGIANPRQRMKAIKEILEPRKDEYRDVIKRGTGDIMVSGRLQVVKDLQEMGRDVGFHEVNYDVIDNLNNNVDEFAIKSFDNKKERIREIMVQTSREGKGVSRAETLLRREFGYMRDYKFRRVARTEGTYARNAVKKQTMRDYAANYQQWLTARDSKVRTAPQDSFDHRAMHGQVIRTDGQFVHPFQNWTLSHPGDRSGALGNIINCRCTIRPYIPSPQTTVGNTPWYPYS